MTLVGLEYACVNTFNSNARAELIAVPLEMRWYTLAKFSVIVILHRKYRSELTFEKKCPHLFAMTRSYAKT